MNPVVFLGPQRFRPTLAAALDRLGIEGRVAAITAGWQEREQEIDELRDHVHRDVANLGLYAVAEETLAADAELAEALRARQADAQELQGIYRQRLAHTLEAAREVMRLDGRREFVREHRQAAIRALRTLDRQHSTRLRRLHGEFEERWRPAERPAVAAAIERLREGIENAEAVAVAGGHVAVLLNRMRLFRLDELLRDKPVVAWSAGAMALTERVVLFHDSPPQGPGDAEVLDAGLRLARGIVALPPAARRLDLDDPVRVALMARRFGPDVPALLDEGAEFRWDGEQWSGFDGSRVLKKRGAVGALRKS